MLPSTPYLCNALKLGVMGGVAGCGASAAFKVKGLQHACATKPAFTAMLAFDGDGLQDLQAAGSTSIKVSGGVRDRRAGSSCSQARIHPAAGASCEDRLHGRSPARCRRSCTCMRKLQRMVPELPLLGLQGAKLGPALSPVYAALMAMCCVVPSTCLCIATWGRDWRAQFRPHLGKPHAKYNKARSAGLAGVWVDWHICSYEFRSVRGGRRAWWPRCSWCSRLLQQQRCIGIR